MYKSVGVLTAVLVWAGAVSPALAHRVRVFALAQGRRVVCRGYFAGGSAARNCAISALLPDGSAAAEGRTDEDGRFTFEAGVRADLTIVLNAGDGHRAEYRLTADQLPADLPPFAAEAVPPSVPSAVPEPVAGTRPARPTTRAAPTALPDEARLKAAVREVVQEELLPLREQLDEARERSRVREIIGGIGFILALAGVIAYYRGEMKRRTSADQS